jgi:aspartyl protease family protein
MIWAIRQAINLALAGLIAVIALGNREDLAGLLAHVSAIGEEPIEPSESGSLTLKADARGHYLITAKVNAKPIRFLVDTGASSVVLSRVDAERLNFRSDELIFTQIYSTPGGLVRAAPVTLGEVQIGALRVRNVKASVSERPMDVSLLGASFLGRLNGYEVSRGKMTLRW